MKKEKKVQLTLMLPKSLIKKIDSLVLSDRDTRSYLMRLFIIEGVERMRRKKKLDN